MRSNIAIILILLCCVYVLLCLEFQPSKATEQSWVRAAYWERNSDLSILSGINASLFTHLVYNYVALDSSNSNYKLSISSEDEERLSNFAAAARHKNPTIPMLFSITIGLGDEEASSLTTLLGNSSYRKSIINSSIKIAKHYGFQGLEFCWLSAYTSADMTNMATLFQEWRAAIDHEAAATNSSAASHTKLILVPWFSHLPNLLEAEKDVVSYLVDSIRRNTDWIHIVTFKYHLPTDYENFTGAHTALYAPYSESSTDETNIDFSIRAWVTMGLPASKLVIGLPAYGYAWKLANPAGNNNMINIGAPTTGPAITGDGRLSYKEIKDYIKRFNLTVAYNSTFVYNYCSKNSSWIGFDNAQTIKIKVSYAKEKKLRGYFIKDISSDDNWELSLAAAQVGAGSEGTPKVATKSRKGRGWRLFLIILGITSSVIFIMASLLFYVSRRRNNEKDEMTAKIFKRKEFVGDFGSNNRDLQVFSLDEMKIASNGFSIENKLGEGGYGPVYKGVLPNGKEIAVKKLSKTSKQGFQELKNEIELTARLQHVNLVKVLGYCIEGDEQLLIYEYMPNRSLDNYLFDPVRRCLLDWRKRVNIIEGVTQGLLYLQEYSRLTIIHRDIKASNILLNDKMIPKISDFGLARIFAKDGVLQASTSHIVGTFGYIPPEYLMHGIYSTKSDVYSFGVLLLQIISGKPNAPNYGSNEDLNLLEYAYVLWREGKGMEFVDPMLDDTLSSCKLIRCIQIGLLCVQEQATDRPSMLEVYTMLKNENVAIAIPKKPAFSSNKSNEDHRLESSNAMLSPENICSVDEATITEVVVR